MWGFLDYHPFKKEKIKLVFWSSFCSFTLCFTITNPPLATKCCSLSAWDLNCQAEKAPFLSNEAVNTSALYTGPTHSADFPAEKAPLSPVTWQMKLPCCLVFPLSSSSHHESRFPPQPRHPELGRATWGGGVGIHGKRKVVRNNEEGRKGLNEELLWHSQFISLSSILSSQE